jgi:hypothetical protein
MTSVGKANRFRPMLGLISIVFSLAMIQASVVRPVDADDLSFTTKPTSAASMAGMADLRLLEITSDPPIPNPWDSINYSSTVLNQGDEGAEVWTWYYVDGSRITGENEYWGHLDPSFSRQVDFGHPGLSEGWHLVEFAVDPEDIVVESDEINNRQYGWFCIGDACPEPAGRHLSRCSIQGQHVFGVGRERPGEFRTDRPSNNHDILHGCTHGDSILQ